MAKDKNIEEEIVRDEEIFEEEAKLQKEDTVKVEVIPNKMGPISWFKNLKTWQKVALIGTGAVVVVGIGGLAVKAIKGGETDTVEDLKEAVSDLDPAEALKEMAEEAGLENVVVS